MYCRKCGNELPNDGKFCPKCGCEAESNTNIKVEKKSKRNKKLPILLVACVLVVALVAVFVGLHIHNENRYNELIAKAEHYLDEGDIDDAVSCWEKAIEIKPTSSEAIMDEIKYYYAIVDAEEALDESKWLLAIDKLKIAIEIKPNIAENYLLLATAYVEEWDLYNAQITLNKGYEKTDDSRLRNVSIWGPLSPVEIAYYMIDGVPVTRGEYLFSDDGINSYIYSYGLPWAGAKYYCENGKVTGVALLDYDGYVSVGIFPQHLCGLPVFDSVITYFDLEYGADENISAVAYDGQTFVTLSYEGDNCTYITAQMDFRSLFSEGDQIRFSYNEENLISETKFGDTYITYEHKADGSCVVRNPRTYSMCTFDEVGLWVGYDSHFSAESEAGHIVSVISDGAAMYEFKYEDNKCLSMEILERLDYIPFDKTEYFYDEINGAERLVRMEYTLPGNIATNELVMEYDDDGKLKRIFSEFNGYDMVLNYVGETLASYVMTGVDYTQTIRTINYDSNGRFIGRN